MKSLALVAAITLVVASFPGSETSRAVPPPEPRIHDGMRPNGPEPEPTLVDRGDQAPNFAYEAPDGQWRRLHDLLEAGGLLLVFGADPEGLRSLESERNALLDLGVVPAAVLDRRSGAAWTMARTLRLHYPVVPDPQGVIAAQFNVLEPSMRRALPAWFVLDHSGRVRALSRHGLPRSGYTGMVAGALSLPAPGASRSTSGH